MMLQISDWIDGVNRFNNSYKSLCRIYNDDEEYYVIKINYEEIVNDYNVTLYNKFNDIMYTDFLNEEDFNQAKFKARKKLADYFTRESMFYSTISSKLIDWVETI